MKILLVRGLLAALAGAVLSACVPLVIGGGAVMGTMVGVLCR